MLTCPFPTLETSAPVHTPAVSPCETTTAFAEVLHKLRVSLLVTTAEAGELIVVRAENHNLNVASLSFASPRCLAVDETRLAITTANGISTFTDVLSESERGLKSDYACYVPRSGHATSAFEPTDLGWGRDGELWAVDTMRSCLATFDRAGRVVPRWRPKFISALEPTDRCHLRGLAMMHNRLTFVTAFGQTDTPRGWWTERARGGVVLNVDDGEIVARGLAMPCSPRIHNGRLWLCESARGVIGRLDPHTGRYEVAATLPGFTRGLALVGDYAFVGVSPFHEGAVQEHRHLGESMCGVCVVDLIRGESVATLPVAGASEVFGVQVLHRRGVKILGHHGA